MRTTRYLIRLLSAFFSRFRGILAIGVFLGFLFFLFFAFLAPNLFGKKKERIGLAGRFTLESMPLEILGLVGDGLTRLDENYVPVPALATSWETPDRGKTWIFHLKEGLTWQDGEKLISEDIVYNFPDVKISYPDASTITFELAEEFSPFPSVVSRPIFKKGFLGTGDWRVDKASLVGDFIQKIRLTNADGVERTYKFYPTEERAKLAFKLGEVDEVEGIFNPTPFDSWDVSSVKKEVNYGQVVTLFFNTAEGALSEKSVRQALGYALAKDKIGQEIALTSINPLSWAYNSQVKQYVYSPERTEDLLGETKPENIRLVTTPVLLSTAERIASYWKDAGLTVSLQVSSAIPSDFDVYLAILDIPEDPDQYSIWHSTQTATNISRFSNARIDKLLEDGRLELNLEERRKIYLDFQRFLAEDLPAIFLYYPETYHVIRK